MFISTSQWLCSFWLAQVFLKNIVQTKLYPFSLPFLLLLWLPSLPAVCPVASLFHHLLLLPHVPDAAADIDHSAAQPSCGFRTRTSANVLPALPVSGPPWLDLCCHACAAAACSADSAAASAVAAGSFITASPSPWFECFSQPSLHQF